MRKLLLRCLLVHLILRMIQAWKPGKTRTLVEHRDKGIILTVASLQRPPSRWLQQNPETQILTWQEEWPDYTSNTATIYWLWSLAVFAIKDAIKTVLNIYLTYQTPRLPQQTCLPIIPSFPTSFSRALFTGTIVPLQHQKPKVEPTVFTQDNVNMFKW